MATLSNLIDRRWGTVPTTPYGTGFTTYNFSATAGQTTFSVNYAYSTTAEYMAVYVNGIRLPKAEYTATNGTTVVLTNAVNLSDEIQIDVFDQSAKIHLNDWLLISTNTNAASGGQYLCDTSSATFTLTLPASPMLNSFVTIADYAGTFATNKLTIARNSSNIMGLAENMDVQTNYASFTLVYSGNATQGWRIV